MTLHLIRQLGHIVFSTPDINRSADDLVDLVGLKVTERRSDRIYLSSNSRRYEVTFMNGPTAGVIAIGLEAMNSEAVKEIATRVKSEGFELIDDRPLGPAIDRAVRFEIPPGLVFEVHTPVLRSEVQRHIGPGARDVRGDGQDRQRRTLSAAHLGDNARLRGPLD
jgi:catechol 2,3-dioxygenase